MLNFVLPAMTLLLMAISVAGCEVSDPANPGGGDAGDASLPPIVRSVAPEATDPAINTRRGNHFVALPADAADRRGQLLVFFPGTGALPEWYASIATRAAELGFHAVNPDYENTLSINFNVCPQQPADCPELARLEILTGAESPYIEPDVDVTNSAHNRLLQLLKHEQANHPDEGWDDYLTPSGEIAWDRIVFAGHSQGGGHAAMTAKLNEVARVLLFGATEPAAWTLEPFATPADRFRGIVHKLEQSYDGITRSWDNIGLPGALVEIVTLPPPMQTQRLVTIAEGCTGDPASSGYYHNCYIVDGWMPAPAADGMPVFAPVWDYLLLDDGQTP